MDTASSISIAMCTCNGEAYLREQLESILAQTVKPDELVVSDDASTDRTLEILNSFKERCTFPVRIFVNSTRLGVCKNFENAIRHCSGDIIFLSDQDDVWLPFKIAKILEAFKEHPLCGYVFSNADLIDDRGQSIGIDLWASIGFDKILQARYASDEQLNVLLRHIAVVYGMTMAFRGAFKPQLMPFECRFFRSTVHDGWISLLLTSIGAYGVALPTLLVKYRQHEKQLAKAGRSLGFLELAVKSRSGATKVDADFANLSEHLALRLHQLDPHSEFVLHAREQLAEKATHVRARVHANRSRGFERFKTVFREALSGRYSRYSRSFKSIVKDLIKN